MTESELKILRQSITHTIRMFSTDPHHSPLKKQKDREIAGRFIDKLNSNTFDTGDLPYYSRDGLARYHNKAECVLAMICAVVLCYWRMAGASLAIQGHVKDTLKDKLRRLNTVYRGYWRLPILGDVKGYCLLESMREDLYGSKKVESKPASQEVSQEKTDEGTNGTGEREETQVDKRLGRATVQQVIADNLLELKGADETSPTNIE